MSDVNMRRGGELDEGDGEGNLPDELFSNPQSLLLIG